MESAENESEKLLFFKKHEQSTFFDKSRLEKQWWLEEDDKESFFVDETTRESNNNFDMDFKKYVHDNEIRVNIDDLSYILVNPENNVTYNCNSIIEAKQDQTDINDDFDSNFDKIFKSSKDKQKETSQLIEFRKKRKLKEIEDRKDYLIKKIKTRVGKYLINLLKRLSPKYHFYHPNSSKFTSNTNITKNQEWFTWSIKTIFITYDKNSKNKAIINKIELDTKHSNDILIILSQSYKTFIKNYFQTEQFQRDANELKEKEKYISFCHEFIDYIKTTKGNKNKKRILNVL